MGETKGESAYGLVSVVGAAPAPPAAFGTAGTGGTAPAQSVVGTELECYCLFDGGWQVSCDYVLMDGGQVDQPGDSDVGVVVARFVLGNFVGVILVERTIEWCTEGVG